MVLGIKAESENRVEMDEGGPQFSYVTNDVKRVILVSETQNMNYNLFDHR